MEQDTISEARDKMFESLEKTMDFTDEDRTNIKNVNKAILEGYHLFSKKDGHEVEAFQFIGTFNIHETLAFIQRDPAYSDSSIEAWVNPKTSICEMLVLSVNDEKINIYIGNVLVRESHGIDIYLPDELADAFVYEREHLAITTNPVLAEGALK